ncbi:MAG TPA: hypothetical protein VHI73_00485 [Solirubrobacteraceae bacterium]|nr:hypothetical protein [Solirubrobacteraceae bacterium]
MQRDAQRLVALERAVGHDVAHAGDPRADALRRGEAMQPVGRGEVG